MVKEEVRRWIESEIELAEERMKLEYNPMFNGVEVGHEKQIELNKAHIQSCRYAIMALCREVEKMKEIKHFICEVCGTEYNGKKKCADCEKGHHKPLEISGANWVSMKNNGSGYPTQIHVKMSNGETITYKR